MSKWLIHLCSAIFFLSGCATSLQKRKENSRRFELCYVTQFQEEVSNKTRSACWSTWLKHYTEEQSYDRIRFAENQIAILSLQETAKTDSQDANEQEEVIDEVDLESLDDESTGIGGSMDDQDASDLKEPLESTHIKKTKLPPPPQVPFTGPCADLCEEQWNTCLSEYVNEISRYRDSCERKFRVCSHGCF